MIVNKPGKYRLLRDYKVHLAGAVYNFSAGTIITIEAIDWTNKKVIGPELGDWVGWDMPVKMIREE